MILKQQNENIKSIPILIICLSMLAFISCRDTKTPHDRLKDIDDSNVESTKMPNGYERDTIDGASNDRQDRIPDEEMIALYGHLNMTQEQIDAYEDMEREYINQATKNTARTQALSDVEKRRAQYMSDILNNEQYERYEQWKENRQNPNQDRENRSYENQ